jgi:hypothetical protein
MMQSACAKITLMLELVHSIKHRFKPWSSKMRKQFIECKSYSTAKRRAPWAYKIIKCDGGYMAFESQNDYKLWNSEK